MRALVVLSLLLSLGSSAAAATGELGGSFHSEGTTRLEGTLDLEWRATGLVLEPPAGTRVTLELQDARLVLVDLPYEEVVLPPPLGNHGYGGHTGREDVLWTGSGAGRLDFTTTEAGTVRVLPADRLTVHDHGNATTLHPAGTTWRPAWRSGPAPLDGLGSVQGVPAVPDGPHTMARAEGPLTLEGRVHVLLGGGDATWGGTALRTGIQRDPDASTTDPLTDSGRRSYHDVVLLVTADVTALTADVPWTVAARSVRGTLDGAAEWRGVAGDVSLDGTGLPPEAHTLRAEGRMDVRSDLRASPASWGVQGDVRSIDVDRSPLLEAAATAAGAGLLLALLLEPVRALLADLLARVWPLRLTTRDGDGSRRRILEAVHEHQPVRVTELEQHTGLSRSALRHHLRLLLRRGVLQAHAAGARNRTYMLNGGSLHFRVQTLEGTVAADAALSVCHGHPVRRSVLERLLEGPAGPDDLLAHLAAQGHPVGRSTLSHHLRRMADAGAVAARRDAGRRTYLLGLDADAVRREQYRRYLAGHGLTEVVQALARRGELDADAVAALVRDVPNAPDPEGLVALAVLERRGTRYRLSPPLAALARRMGGAS